MGKKNIQSIIYLSNEKEESCWCGLTQYGTFFTSQMYGYENKIVPTSLVQPQAIRRFSAFNLDRGKTFAYDASKEAFIFTDSTVRINGKIGVKLVSIKDIGDVWASSFIGSKPNITSAAMSNDEIAELLTVDWLEEKIPSVSNDKFNQALYLLDVLIKSKDKRIAICAKEDQTSDAIELMKYCLYLLPKEVANTISFNTNSRSELLTKISVTQCHLDCSEMIESVYWDKIHINADKEPSSYYCTLIKLLGRNDSIKYINATEMIARMKAESNNNAISDIEALNRLEVEAKARLVNAFERKLREECQKLLKSKKAANDPLKVIRNLCDDLIKYDALDRGLQVLAQEFGKEAMPKEIDESIRDFLLEYVTQTKTSVEQVLFDCFMQISGVSDIFLKNVWAEVALRTVRGREEDALKFWQKELLQLNNDRHNNEFFDAAQKACRIVFDCYCDADLNKKIAPYFNKKDNASGYYAWIFSIANAFGSIKIKDLENKVSKSKGNVEKQRRYLALFGKPEKINQLKQKRHNTSGFYANAFFSIIAPAILVWIALYLGVLNLPLDQILFWAGYPSLNDSRISSVLAGIICLIGMLAGAITFAVLTSKKQNSPPNVICCRMLFVEATVYFPAVLYIVVFASVYALIM